MNPAVSVIVPVFERPDLIRRALDSVLLQSAPVAEVIVIDDASSDDTAAVVVQSYPGVTLIRNESNRGVSYSRNIGIKQASGEWIALLDSDDAWEPAKLERQLALVAQQSNANLIHTNEIWIRNGKRVNQGDRHEKAGGWIYQRCLPLCAISPSSVMIHKRVFADVGLFDESLPACEDYDLWLRITARFETHFIDEPLVIKYGGHDDQLSRRYPGMDRFRVKALSNMLDSDILQGEDRDRTIETLLEKASVYLGGVKKRGRHEEAAQIEALIQRWGNI